MKVVRQEYLQEYKEYFKKDLNKLELSAEDVHYLLNRRYKVKTATMFGQCN